MIKLLSVVVVAMMVFGSVESKRHGCWTKWYNRDYPRGSGDFETLSKLREENPGEICKYPFEIEAVTSRTLTPAYETGQIIYLYSPTKGFVCRNKDQKRRKCRDYKVRFLCPCFE